MVKEISRKPDVSISCECKNVYFYRVAHLRFGNITGNTFDDFVLKSTVRRV